MQQPNTLTEEQKKEIQRRIHRSVCMQRAFSGEDGVFSLKTLDELVHYKGNTFDPDPYQSAYNQGQRSVMVFIHNCIDQNIEEAKKLLGEEK
jgi:hypothetical protein